MSAEFPMTFPAAAVSPRRVSARRLADQALKAAAKSWFVVAIAGQLLFAFTVASFYGLTAARGDWWAWNRSMSHGYTAGKPLSNFIVAMHLASAVVIILIGALQFVSLIRNRFPVVHRWMGRIYMITAFTVSGAGVYLLWFRGTVGDASQHWGFTLDAALIGLCAVMAWRYALARNFKLHRRWTLRLFLVVSASWFFRVGLFLSFLIFRGPFGFDPNTFTGPFLTFLAFAQSLVPLAVAELFFRAQDHPGAMRRFAMASGLFVLTLATGAGVAMNAMGSLLPSIQIAFDGRKSIVQTLSSTIESNGIDAAIRQYHELEATQPKAYIFDEKQLNTLGYQLLRAKRVKEAIRIFALNVEAYPRSSNTYDSLGEAYLGDGNKPQAITQYRKALQLDPKKKSAMEALRKLQAL